MGYQAILFWLVLQAAGFCACAENYPGGPPDAVGNRGAAPVEAVSELQAAGGKHPAGVSGQLLVKVQKGAAEIRVAQILSEAGLEVIRKISPDLLLVVITRGVPPEEIIQHLLAHPEIQFAETNTTRTFREK